MKVFRYKIKTVHGAAKEGFLIQTDTGWGEILSSVSFALEAARHFHTQPFSWPAAALLMGSSKEILQHAEKCCDFRVAKLKVGQLPLPEAIALAKELKGRFRLRIDVNCAWTPEQAREFCSHFSSHDFDFLEDPCKEPIDLPMPIAYDAVEGKGTFSVWKPSLKGLPPPLPNLILSSAYETGLGLGTIAQLAKRLQLSHPIGIGTHAYLEDDLLQEPLTFSHGMVHVPLLRPDLSKLEEI